MLLIKYENLVKNPNDQIKKINQYLNLQNKINTNNSQFTVLIPKLQLGSGTYDLDVYFVEFNENENEKILAHYKNFITLNVKNSIISNHSSFQLISKII